jgi:hypothetical protein
VRTLEPGLAITTPVGKTVVCKRVVCECPINICERVLPANLIVLLMFSYDIILRIDCLMRHSVLSTLLESKWHLRHAEKEM